MCGICGAYNLEDRPLLEKMTGAMLHRGPDDCGYFTDKGIMLGHRRLSIIDLTTGKQPISNEDGSITVVFNGEIYNFQELRSELEGKGHRFATKTDTEVIVHAYEEHGPSCVKLFNGMFAFAVWDGNKKQLMLARDRYGIKPLYYAWVGDSLVFASEAKPILLHPDFKRRVDLQALHLFINLRYIPGDFSIFQGIRKLPHSHYALVKNGKMALMRYFTLDPTQGDFTEEYCAERLLSLLKAAVKRHMIADVPVGVYLSGGLDSSTITALASEASDEPLRTFSMGFGQPDDEFADARVVAEHFGTEHKEISIKASVLKDFPKILWYMGTPKRNVYPYYLAQAASRHVKVIQSGLGGDELFGGYTFKYDALNGVLKKRQQAKPDYASIKASIAGLDPVMEYDKIDALNRQLHLNDDTWGYLHVTSMDRVYDLDYLNNAIYGKKMQGLTEVHDFFKPYFKNKNGLVENSFVADFDVKMADDFLAVDDGTSMANSLETRVPFLDNWLVEFAFSMPTGLKLRDGSGKYILRKTMAPLLPKAVLEKKKQGFATNTIAVWEEEMMEYAKQRLLEGSIVKEGYVKKDYVEKVLRAGTSKRMLFHYNTMWNLLAFEVWHNVFMEGGDISKPPKSGL